MTLDGSKGANGVIDSIAGSSHLSDGFFMSVCSSAEVYGPSLWLEFKTAAPWSWSERLTLAAARYFFALLKHSVQVMWITTWSVQESYEFIAHNFLIRYLINKDIFNPLTPTCLIKNWKFANKSCSFPDTRKISTCVIQSQWFIF